MTAFKIRLYALLLAGGIVSAFTGSGKAHDFYSPSCCHGTEVGGDCFPIPIDAVEELGAKGWHVKYVSEKFGAIDAIAEFSRKRDSEDGRFHICVMYMGEEKAIRCIYVPSVVHNGLFNRRYSLIKKDGLRHVL